MTRPTVSRFRVPDLGVGVGFRVPHYRHVLTTRPEMDWFEVISENFMVDGGAPRHHLDQLRARYPVVPHGVSMSLGDVETPGYMDRLSALLAELRPPWASDHLCFTGTGGHNTHDLLPVPYTPAVLDHVVDRVKAVQDRLQLPFAVENPSSYLAFAESTMPEWAFLAELAERADCALLLDVNNVYVSSINHGFDPREYLAAVPADRVVQLHLAGHTIVELPAGSFRIDTHDAPVCDPVWALYAEVIQRMGRISTLIEWDDHIPDWDRLSAEAARARALRDACAPEPA